MNEGAPLKSVTGRTIEAAAVPHTRRVFNDFRRVSQNITAYGDGMLPSLDCPVLSHIADAAKKEVVVSEQLKGGSKKIGGIHTLKGDALVDAMLRISGPRLAAMHIRRAAAGNGDDVLVLADLRDENARVFVNEWTSSGHRIVETVEESQRNGGIPLCCVAISADCAAAYLATRLTTPEQGPVRNEWLKRLADGAEDNKCFVFIVTEGEVVLDCLPICDPAHGKVDAVCRCPACTRIYRETIQLAGNCATQDTELSRWCPDCDYNRAAREARRLAMNHVEHMLEAMPAQLAGRGMSDVEAARATRAFRRSVWFGRPVPVQVARDVRYIV